MDLSALIFVALAVAWARPLPRAEGAQVPRGGLRPPLRRRVLRRRRRLARREAVLLQAELIPAGRKLSAKVEEPEAPAEPEVAYDEEPRRPPLRRVPRVRPSRGASPRDARPERRRRVFMLLLLTLVVAGLGIRKVIGLAWTAAPLRSLTWLVACRLMVRRERLPCCCAFAGAAGTLADEAIADEDAEDIAGADEAAEVVEVVGEFDADDNTDEIPVRTAALLEEEPVLLDADAVPGAPAADVRRQGAGGFRTVRTIDLDSTGVWSSGRNEADSQLAREADAQRAQADADAAPADDRRASGS